MYPGYCIGMSKRDSLLYVSQQPKADAMLALPLRKFMLLNGLNPTDIHVETFDGQTCP
jgi:hypothetical protein